MAENTKIEWCDHTFNGWIGCTEVSKARTGGGGCDGCYAKVSTPVRALRSKGIETWGPGAQRVRTQTWGDPVKWNKQAFFECRSCHWRGTGKDAGLFGEGVNIFCATCTKCGHPGGLHRARARVFCASLADVFDNEVPDEWRADLFDLIAKTPNLDWLLLTKRIGNVGNMLPVPFDFDKQYPNVWLGATIVNQEEADRDIPKLLAVPAAKRFLSMEPLLGPVDLQRARLLCCPNGGSCWSSGKGNERLVRDSESGGFVFECACSRLNGLDWVIVGGESGPGARPMHPDWARSLRDQCEAAGVAFLFKQWGEWAPSVRSSVISEGIAMPGQNGAVWAFADGTRDGWRTGPIAVRIGKKAAGRQLDGRTWDEVPG